jgi:hypothetical protein
MNSGYTPSMVPMSAAGLGTGRANTNPATAPGAAGPSINARRGGGVEYISGHECVVKGPNGEYVVLKCPACGKSLLCLSLLSKANSGLSVGGNGKFKGTDWMFLQGPKGFQEHLRLVHNLAPAEPRGRRPRGWAFVFGRCIVRRAEAKDLDPNHPDFASERAVVQSRSDALAASTTTTTTTTPAPTPSGPLATVGPPGRKRPATTQGPFNADEDEEKDEASIDNDEEGADETGITELEKVLAYAKKRARHVVAASGPNAAMLGDGSLSFLERAVQEYQLRDKAAKQDAPVGVEEEGEDEGAAGEVDNFDSREH